MYVDVFCFEIMFDIDAERAFREIPDMPFGGDDLIIAAEIRIDGGGLRRLLDNDQIHMFLVFLHCETFSLKNNKQSLLYTEIAGIVNTEF